MQFIARCLSLIVLLSALPLTSAQACLAGSRGCELNKCCGNMGGIRYCDSSAGRFVCNNGYYSSCYCDRHAIMDLRHIPGCCVWQGGVSRIDPTGQVVCNNGGISEECTLQNPVEPVASW